MYNDDVDIDNKDTRRGARGGKYLEKKTKEKRQQRNRTRPEKKKGKKKKRNDNKSAK